MGSIWHLTHGCRRPTHGCRRPGKRPATPLQGWNKPDTTGGGETAAKIRRGLKHFIFLLKKKRSSSLRGKWHHCSASDDRAMRCGCLNSDITAGSQSPVQHRRGRGQGTKAAGPGRGDITTQHKTPLHRGRLISEDADVFKESVQALFVHFSCPHPTTQPSMPIHQAEASPRSSGRSESLIEE